MEQRKYPNETLDLLDVFEDDILENLDVTCLMQFLEDSNLLTEDEMKSLRKLEQNRRDAAAEFLLILKTKGHGTLSLFIAALGTEKEHTGHKQLYEMLKPTLKPNKEEIVSPKDALSQHQVVRPVEQLTKTADQSSMVLATSLSVGTESLVSGKLQNGTLSSFSSGAIWIRSRCPPTETLMQHQNKINILTNKVDNIDNKVDDIDNKVDDIDKKVTALVQSASLSLISNTNERVIVHRRSASCDYSSPVENLIFRKKNSGDHYIPWKQVTRDDPPKLVCYC